MLLTHDKNESITRAKSVRRETAMNLAQTKFGQSPLSNEERTKTRKMHLDPIESGVTIVDETKSLSHSFNFNRIAINPVQSTALI